MAVRLNKFLSEMGVCSRREADRFIEQGKVTVDGKIAVMGMKIENQQVCCNGVIVKRQDGRPKTVWLAVNKPQGIVCTTSDHDRAPNIVEMVSYPQRIYPVGRLDKDSEGLILMTNQGELVNKMMRAGNYHQKEYLVTVDRPINQSFIEKMGKGVFLKELEIMSLPCQIEKLSQKQFKIILTQGLNRQIRRMCQEFGYQVVQLKRVRIMNIMLGDLKAGSYRELSSLEYKELQKQLELSTNKSYKESRNAGKDS